MGSGGAGGGEWGQVVLVVVSGSGGAGGDEWGQLLLVVVVGSGGAGGGNGVRWCWW